VNIFHSRGNPGIVGFRTASRRFSSTEGIPEDWTSVEIQGARSPEKNGIPGSERKSGNARIPGGIPHPWNSLIHRNQLWKNGSCLRFGGSVFSFGPVFRTESKTRPGNVRVGDGPGSTRIRRKGIRNLHQDNRLCRVPIRFPQSLHISRPLKNISGSHGARDRLYELLRDDIGTAYPCRSKAGDDKNNDKRGIHETGIVSRNLKSDKPIPPDESQPLPKSVTKNNFISSHDFASATAL
jgi:hypothetical protein